jgi:16S rRNA (adenine1518-N6/adenine1519-N6)-dimethyltransferase
MTAQPGQKSYSSFTVLCRSCFFVEQKGELKPGSFYPVPEVASSIVELRPDPAAPAGESLLLLSKLARGLFSSRRKTLRNNAIAFAAASPLAGFGSIAAEDILGALAKEGVDPGCRAEEVTPEVYVEVARALTGSASP